MRLTNLVASLAAVGLSACASPPPPGPTSVLEAQPIVLPGSGWDAADIDAALAGAREQMGLCGIALQSRNAIRAAESLAADWPLDGREHERARMIAPDEPVATILFARVIADGSDEPAIEGRTLLPPAPPFVILAEAGGAGALAHELGHILGLGHAPRYAIDRMAPNGCRFCEFTDRQCRTMRRSPLLAPIRNS